MNQGNQFYQNKQYNQQKFKNGNQSNNNSWGWRKPTENTPLSQNNNNNLNRQQEQNQFSKQQQQQPQQEPQSFNIQQQLHNGFNMNNLGASFQNTNQPVQNYQNNQKYNQNFQQFKPNQHDYSNNNNSNNNYKKQFNNNNNNNNYSNGAPNFYNKDKPFQNNNFQNNQPSYFNQPIMNNAGVINQSQQQEQINPRFEAYIKQKINYPNEPKQNYYSNNLSTYNNNNSNNSQNMGKNLHPIDWSKVHLEPFQKCFYNETPKKVQRDSQEVEQYRKNHEIVIRKSHIRCPQPFMEFSSVCLPDYLIEQIEHAGFSAPTPIQAQSWPILLKGLDLIGIAKTGSGKSLAYILPAIIHINAQPPVQRGDSPIVVVLAPTRELAFQIQDECEKFGITSNLNTVCCYGGVPKKEQCYKLKAGCDLLVACPGRLIDILEMGVIDLKRTTYLVIDEADRMLDMGFEPQIRKIISQIRPDRQTCMWSATWPKAVQQLANEFLINPLHIQIGQQSDLTSNTNIQQIIEVISNSKKDERCLELLLDFNSNLNKVIIFTETKKGCDRLNYLISRQGWKSLSIHGDKSQEQRDFAINSFKQGNCSILVATDVAARGLDVNDIKCVINYDMSKNIEDYVHRIGRTGRANAKGYAYTLFSEESERIAAKTISVLQKGNNMIPEGLQRLADLFQKKIPITEKIFNDIYLEYRMFFQNLTRKIDQN